jgi:NADH ubiquinone oxidoreductase, 20 Kd subunit/CobW/HypB/UreG, nucleotide-binding domain
LTAGLGCDGDTIAVTAATQPSLEDLILGTFPWVPKIRFHNPFLAFENGDEFVHYFRQAAAGEMKPFIFVVEGSIPNERNKTEGYWASFGFDKATGQPITTCDWIDALTPKAWAVVAAGTCAAYGGIHAMERNPTGAMGLPDYLGWTWKTEAGIPIARARFSVYRKCRQSSLSRLASYDLGEDLRAVLLSVTEGEDKPLKYPTIFNGADVAIITKADLADAVQFDEAAARRNIQAVRPGMKVFTLSAKTGAGMPAFLAFLEGCRSSSRAAL